MLTFELLRFQSFRSLTELNPNPTRCHQDKRILTLLKGGCVIPLCLASITFQAAEFHGDPTVLCAIYTNQLPLHTQSQLTQKASALQPEVSQPYYMRTIEFSEVQGGSGASTDQPKCEVRADKSKKVNQTTSL